MNLPAASSGVSQWTILFFAASCGELTQLPLVRRGFSAGGNKKVLCQNYLFFNELLIISTFILNLNQSLNITNSGDLTCQ